MYLELIKSFVHTIANKDLKKIKLIREGTNMDGEGGLIALILGFLALFLILGIVWYIILIIGNWRILSKAGKPGWYSLIPFLNIYEEYEICWKGWYGLLYIVLFVVASVASSSATGEDPNIVASIVAAIAGIGALVIRIVQSAKLAKAFGRGTVFTIFLIIFERITRLVLGLGSSQYVGKE